MYELDLHLKVLCKVKEEIVRYQHFLEYLTKIMIFSTALQHFGTAAFKDLMSASCSCLIFLSSLHFLQSECILSTNKLYTVNEHKIDNKLFFFLPQMNAFIFQDTVNTHTRGIGSCNIKINHSRYQNRTFRVVIWNVVVSIFFFFF